MDNRTFRRLSPRNDAHAVVDANCEKERNHIIWDISEYAVSRILSPSRLPHVQVQRFVAHERILRSHRRSLSSCARDAVQTALLGSRGPWRLADRLAEDEQGRLTGSGFLTARTCP